MQRHKVGTFNIAVNYGSMLMMFNFGNLGTDYCNMWSAKSFATLQDVD